MGQRKANEWLAILNVRDVFEGALGQEVWRAKETLMLMALERKPAVTAEGVLLSGLLQQCKCAQDIGV